jgi:Na+/proline symporter
MALLDSLYQALLPWLPLLTMAGLVMALTSTIALPWLLLRIHTEYFVSQHKPKRDRTPLDWLIWLLRNAVAIVLLIAGLLMLVLPGQGLLTILIAISASTFPGKYQLERAIIRRRSVFKAANWIRARYHRPPIIHPDEPKHHDQSLP